MEPDKTEKAIRFGCGFVFGVIAGFLAAFSFVMDSWSMAAAVIFAAAVVCGVLAMKQGDSFWHSLKNWWWWP